MNDYELVTILNGEVKDEDVEDTVGRISQFITNRGGEVQNIDQWGRRRLAYPISRQFEGTYVVTHLRLPPANAAELEANLRISEDVLRHLLVRYSPAEQAAAIAAAQRRRPRPLSEEGDDEATSGEAPAAAGAPEAAADEPVMEPTIAEAPEPAEAVASAEEPAETVAPADETAVAEAEPTSSEAAEAGIVAAASEPVEAEEPAAVDAAPAAVEGEPAEAATNEAAPRRTRTRKPKDEA